MNAFEHRALNNNMTCGHVDADQAFTLVDQEGFPLMAIIELLHEKKAILFPWYGYARRRWNAGKTQESVICEIRDALSLNRGFAKWEDVKVDLLNLWPNLS